MTDVDGREIVNAIREYERRNGQSWRALDPHTRALSNAYGRALTERGGISSPPMSPTEIGEIVAKASRASLLKGAPERRGISEFEIRDGSNGLLKFTGYAAIFEQPYTVTDRFGEFTETIERSALARTLSRNPDVVLNVNHDGLPLARTTSGTLRIGTDSHGYHVEADLEPRDPDVDRIRHKLERGDMSEMSWAFRVLVDEWSDEETARSIREVSVDGGDVSIVTTGANRQTTANPLRSALLALADPDIDLNVLVECRAEGIDLDVIRKNLDALAPERVARKTLSIRAAERALELG